MDLKASTLTSERSNRLEVNWGFVTRVMAFLGHSFGSVLKRKAGTLSQQNTRAVLILEQLYMQHTLSLHLKF